MRTDFSVFLLSARLAYKRRGICNLCVTRAKQASHIMNLIFFCPECRYAVLTELGTCELSFSGNFLALV
jgi:hypothetical protein